MKFLVKSTNQHGVHSPFVFDYLTKCLYPKPKESKNKVEDLVLKSVPYFNLRNISINDNGTLQKKLANSFADRLLRKETFDMIYFSRPSSKNAEQPFQEFPLHNNTLIIYENIHESKETYDLWKQLSQMEIITVSIDMFHCGVLFVRKQQVKQHFTIRI